MKKEDSKSNAKSIYEEIQGGVNEVISKIREIIKEGGARRLIIKNKKGDVVFQTQLAIGVGGATLVGAMAPVISAIGMFAMFINDYQILVEREVDGDEDKYSTEAQIIEITEDDDEAESEPTKSTGAKDKDDDEDEKTIGKKKK